MAESVNGILKVSRNGGGILVDLKKPFRSHSSCVHVPVKLVKKMGLISGAVLEGEITRSKRTQSLATVTSVSGLSPESFQRRVRFKELVPIDPEDRFELADCGNISMRLVNMLVPLGKGSRCLIVSPPRAGKTLLLQQIAKAIRFAEPETRIIVLLVDERPEEVTDFRRSVDADVFASTNDRSSVEHVQLTRLTLSHARVELECGRNVVVLVDSLTRIGRAFNMEGLGTGRIMSGGLDAGALEVPRKFFGLARNIEGGGSVTMIATALIDTGSRMDKLIFEEFKGTGNSEIVLDRDLADERIYPAIDIAASGTRKEHLLLTPFEQKRIKAFRRTLVDRKPSEAMTSLLNVMLKHETNREFLESLPVVD